MKDVIIGLDIGTSSVKAAAFDRNGRLLSTANAPIALYSPAPGWAEQEPGDWWAAACMVLKEVLEEVDVNRLAGLGLSGQCPSHVLVSAGQESIGRAIIWRDERAIEEAAWLGEHIRADRAQKWIGSANLSDPTCPPARLLWLKRHRADDWQRAVVVLEPKDYIGLRLTGRSATDRHSAYLLANPENGSYDPDYFAALDIPLRKMPPVLRPTEELGSVTASGAAQTGLPAGLPVIIGTIDAFCDNLAGGIVHPDRAVDVVGTSESVSLAVERMLEAPGVFAAYLEGGGAFLCGPTQAGGDTLRWLYRSFYADSSQPMDFQKMENEARLAPAGSGGLIFLPYLNGERAPLWDAGARGAFIGLTFEHDRRHCTRAVYEGVGYAVRHILEIAEKAAGRKAGQLVITGGGSRSAFWNQVKADILQRPVQPTEVSETGCLGAAIIASVAVGTYVDYKAACDGMITLAGIVTPDPALVKVYEAGYQAFRAYYPALKPVLSVLALKEGG